MQVKMRVNCVLRPFFQAVKTLIVCFLYAPLLKVGWWHIVCPSLQFSRKKSGIFPPEFMSSRRYLVEFMSLNFKFFVLFCEPSFVLSFFIFFILDTVWFFVYQASCGKNIA